MLGSDHTQNDRERHVARVAANDAFAAAMNAAIRKGRENVRPGTFVDETPPERG